MLVIAHSSNQWLSKKKKDRQSLAPDQLLFAWATLLNHRIPRNPIVVGVVRGVYCAQHVRCRCETKE